MGKLIPFCVFCRDPLSFFLHTFISYGIDMATVHPVFSLLNRSVFVGADKVTGDIVALKRINTEQEENGFPITAIREVKILKALDYVNIIKLKEIVTSKGTLVKRRSISK
jgi:hypothetical protein